MGMVNFCSLSLREDPKAYPAQLSTAIHELGHALGFTADRMAFMRQADGTPRTPRDARGLPPISMNYECPNGNVMPAIYLPSSSTIRFFYERGHTVAKLVTPNVLAFVRNYFNCSDLNGAELENQDESACYGSHWEERIFEPEIMSPLISFRVVKSALTLVYIYILFHICSRSDNLCRYH
jgi:leishmanolysin-like peptidase